jgi:prepilin-type N-terminal cleavage/methylation domain-containing protein
MQGRAPRGLARGRAAFSLLELLITLGLISIVLATAAIAWPRVDAALQLDAGLHQIAGDLHAAQTLAIASASRVRVVFPVGADVYQRERMDDAGNYQPDLTRRLPSGIQIVAANSGGDLVFSARGQGENGTVTLGDRQGVHRGVRLNQRGRVTILPVGP